MKRNILILALCLISNWVWAVEYIQDNTVNVSADHFEKLSQKTHAILFAVDSGIHPTNDAKLIRDFLEKSCETADIIECYNENASKDDLNKALDDMKERSTSQDRLFVYIGCHGVSYKKYSLIIPHRVIHFENLNPEDSDLRNKIEARGFYFVDTLLEQISKIPSKETIVLIDIGRSDLYGDSNVETTNIFNDIQKVITKNGKKNFSVITTCSAGEKAYEGVFGTCKVPHSLYSYYFIEGLCGPADAKFVYNTEVSFAEAHNYAFEKVNEKIKKTNEDKSKSNLTPQTPELFQVKAQTVTFSKIARMKTEDILNNEMAYLRYCGEQLADERYGRPAKEAALKVWDAIIKNAPDDKSAYLMRGNVHRYLYDFESALEDYKKVGRLLVLYGGSERLTAARKRARSRDKSIPNYTDATGRTEAGVEIKYYDILYISEVSGDYLKVAKVGPVEITTDCWVRKEHVCWATMGNLPTLGNLSSGCRYNTGRDDRIIIDPHRPSLIR